MIKITSLVKTCPGNGRVVRALAGIANPSGGPAFVDGHNLSPQAGKQAVKSMLGYLPQELGMYTELSACKFVDYMAILKRPPLKREGVAFPSWRPALLAQAGFIGFGSG